MKLSRALAMGVSALALMANVGAIPYVLDSSGASFFAGNTTSTFFEFTPPGTETGTAAGLYNASLSGNEDSGWTVTFTWGGHAQPTITSAFLKAADFYMKWDAADFAAFNAGMYDSLVLVQNGIVNQFGKFHEVSHAGFLGEPGPEIIPSVPDGGPTAILLGIVFIGLFFGMRFPSKTRRLRPESA